MLLFFPRRDGCFSPESQLFPHPPTYLLSCVCVRQKEDGMRGREAWRCEREGTTDQKLWSKVLSGGISPLCPPGADAIRQFPLLIQGGRKKETGTKSLMMSTLRFLGCPVHYLYCAFERWRVQGRGKIPSSSRLSLAQTPIIKSRHEREYRVNVKLIAIFLAEVFYEQRHSLSAHPVCMHMDGRCSRERRRRRRSQP